MQPQCCLLYFVVVEIVHEDLHDAREEKHTGAGDDKFVYVVKWLILLLFGSWYKLQEGMSLSDLEAWNWH